MAGRRKNSSNVRPFRSKQVGSKRQRRPRRGDDGVKAAAPDEIVETGYAVEWFPITRDDADAAARLAKRHAKQLGIKDPSEIDSGGWREGYDRAHLNAAVSPSFGMLFRGASGTARAAAIGAGIISGIDSSAMLEAISAALAKTPSVDLYADPVDETKRDVFEGRLSFHRHMRSEREDADDHVVVAMVLTLEDIIGPFLHFAVNAAFEAAMILGRDIAANSSVRMLRPKQRVIQFSDADKKDFVARTTTELRDMLARVLGDSTRIQTAGRKAEDARDHRAYCLRERLFLSPDSAYAHLPEYERRRRAKRDVMRDVILRDRPGATCSESNWWRILRSGKAVHERIAPGSPYCERVP